MSATTLECGHADSLPFGRDEAGNRYCYPCCTERNRATIADAKPGQRLAAYESRDGQTITNWPGSQLMRVVWHGQPHPWSRERRYLSAVDELGRIWSGTAAPGMWATLRLTKQTQ